MITSLSKAENFRIYGNKAKGLYDLMKMGLPVPAGFAIQSGTSVNDIKSFIKRYCDEKKIYVARSSSNAEDSAHHSFAGLFNTVVGVAKKDLFAAIKKVMYMENNERIKEFCKKIKRPLSSIKVAVVVQEIVPSEISGVCFTMNPMTKVNEIYAEAILGQGEYLVSGEITPDSYYISKKTFKAHKIKVATQHKMFTLVDGKAVDMPVFNYTQKLSEKLIHSLAIGADKIEKFYGKQMDIEFAVYKNKIYYLQARPITT